MSGEKLWIHGKRGFQKLLRATKEDIWNMDETGVFWQALLDRGFGQKGKHCYGGKKSKKQVTVAFFVSVAGTKEKPILMWKSKNPRCLRNFEKSALPVDYFGQKKALITGKIMDAVLTKLNRRLSRSNRSIILLMDNAGCHPENLAGKFSNIRFVFCLLTLLLSYSHWTLA